MSNEPEIEVCPECDGAGWVIVWGHACNGDEPKCQYMCPIQEQAICPTCGGLSPYVPDLGESPASDSESTLTPSG